MYKSLVSLILHGFQNQPFIECVRPFESRVRSRSAMLAMTRCVVLLASLHLATSQSQLSQETLRRIDCQLASEACDHTGSNLNLLQVKGRMVSEETAKAERIIMKGVSYGPSPFTSAKKNKHQDYFCDAAEPQWGEVGRGDLRIIRSLGANTVRLYGNDPDSRLL